METFVAAVDIGASSGRVLVGCLNSQNKLTIEEVHRFENGFLPSATVMTAGTSTICLRRSRPGWKRSQPRHRLVFGGR